MLINLHRIHNSLSHYPGFLHLPGAWITASSWSLVPPSDWPSLYFIFLHHCFHCVAPMFQNPQGIFIFHHIKPNAQLPIFTAPPNLFFPYISSFISFARCDFGSCGLEIMEFLYTYTHTPKLKAASFFLSVIHPCSHQQKHIQTLHTLYQAMGARLCGGHLGVE